MGGVVEVAGEEAAAVLSGVDGVCLDGARWSDCLGAACVW